jgi:hypothetical protein
MEMTEINKERGTELNPITNQASERFLAAKRSLADFLNDRVNRLSATHKRISLLIFGFMMGTTCLLQVVQAVTGDKKQSSFSIESITLPKNINMTKSDTQKLIPVGKLKGEMDGEFEAFHIAVDHEGQLFINRNPEFSKDSLNKSKGWEPITRQQLETYQKQLHFIPSHKKGLKR